jgi:hypothetical protein
MAEIAMDAYASEAEYAGFAVGKLCDMVLSLREYYYGRPAMPIIERSWDREEKNEGKGGRTSRATLRDHRAGSDLRSGFRFVPRRFWGRSDRRRKALEKLNSISPRKGPEKFLSCLSADELQAKAKVLGRLYGLQADEVPDETEKEFIHLFAGEVLDFIAGHKVEMLWGAGAPERWKAKPAGSRRKVRLRHRRPVRTHPDPVSGPARRARMMKGASGHYTAHPFKGLGFKSD